jgi:hypothetical protein
LDPDVTDENRGLIELAERYADGSASKAELKASFLAQGKLRYFDGLPALFPFAYDAAYHSALRFPSDVVLPVLHDIFGNPYRQVKVDRSWLTEDVCSLARAIYSDRTFDRMPELATALEDAGCKDAGVISHCREENRHFRGCWVVDLVLGLN